MTIIGQGQHKRATEISTPAKTNHLMRYLWPEMKPGHLHAMAATLAALRDAGPYLEELHSMTDAEVIKVEDELIGLIASALAIMACKQYGERFEHEGVSLSLTKEIVELMIQNHLIGALAEKYGVDWRGEAIFKLLGLGDFVEYELNDDGVFMIQFVLELMCAEARADLEQYGEIRDTRTMAS